MSTYLTNYEWPGMPPIPDWYDPENENSTIAAIIYSAQMPPNIPDDAVFDCPPRYVNVGRE